MNVQVKPFDDVRVRQAFRLIVDRPQMIAQGADGLQWLGNDMYAPFDPGYPKDLPQREQDLEQAKSLLKQAGQESMTVKLVTSTSVSNNAPAAATVFAQQAQAAGVTVKVDNVTGDVFWGDQYLKWGFAMDNWGTRGYLAQTGMGTMPGSLYDETHWADDQPEVHGPGQGGLQDGRRRRARNDLISRGLHHRVRTRARYIVYAFDNQVDAMAADASWAWWPTTPGSAPRQQRALPPRLVRVTCSPDRSAAFEQAPRPHGRGACRAA